MSLEDRFNFEDLVNEGERLVLAELEVQLADQPGGVTGYSEDEVLDMAAYALNHIRPLYRVNLLGRIYAQNVGEQYEQDVETAVREAISRINREAGE
jgi:competence protein ComFB